MGYSFPMRYQHIATAMSTSMFGVALIVLSPWNSKAATLNTTDFPDTNFSVISDTPTFLDLTFDSPLISGKGPATPIGNPLIPEAEGGSAILGPIIPVFSSDYWNVSVQNRIDLGFKLPQIYTVDLFVEQVILGESNVPKGSFSTLTFGRLPSPLQRVSYLSDSPAQTFSAFEPLGTSSIPPGYADQLFIAGDACARGSANCISSDLTFASLQDSTVYNYELRGFFQSADVTEAVPEPSTIVGSLTALAMIAFMRLKKTLLNRGSI
jgi:hypothetical protein